MISIINITGSEAALEDCRFQDNCFVRLQSQGILTISNCLFHSYNHVRNSIVAMQNSTITLSEIVIFINNTVGNKNHACGAVFSFNFGYNND